MTGLYVYAVLESGSPVVGTGLAGEPLRLVRCGDLAAALTTTPVSYTHLTLPTNSRV